MKIDWQKIGKISVKVLGVLCIIVGILGLFLPIIQGILLILIGLGLLGDHRLMNWFKKKFNIKENSKK
jgi:uncharacterized protein YqgC (DUF456 family)